MDIKPEISTYMECDIQDKPAQIELHTYWDSWNGVKVFTTATYDSKEHNRKQSVTFLGWQKDKLFDRHEMMVNQYKKDGYQVINEDYSPEIQDELDRIKIENDNLEKLLEGIKIPDKIV